jgi:xanthine/uracil permease
VAIALGLAWFGLAWGLFTGKGWSWLITVIFAIITVVVSIIGVLSGSITSIPTLIINGVILYYMYRPHIKSYFGRVSIPK